MKNNEDFRDLLNEFFKHSVGKVIIQVLYPSLVLYIQQKFIKKAQIKEQLFQLGELLAVNYLLFGDPVQIKRLAEKYGTLLHNKIFKNIFRKMLNNKKAYLKKIDENTYHIIDPNCFICGDIEIEGIGAHLCTPFAGLTYKILKELSPNNEEHYTVDTIASRWMQSPVCIHEIKVIRGNK